ncbi:MAG: nucleoside 2-deoxyribosyltransferase [Candidatus Moraniibacteriota bacterium]
MSKKIYFAGSIRGGREDKDTYFALVEVLSRYGQVLTEHVGDKSLTEYGEDGSSDEYIYQRDLAWLREADLVIAEISTPSLGVGYEIAKAEEMKKEIICLYKKNANKRISAMLSGNSNLKTFGYTDLQEALKIIEAYLSEKNTENFNM